MILTYKYRIKDSSSRKALCTHASKINFVWNYCNSIKRRGYLAYQRSEPFRFVSKFDLNKLVGGSSNELDLHSQTIQAVAEKLSDAIKASPKHRVNWRSYKRSLGWIPFKKEGIRFREDFVLYQGKEYKIYKSRPLPADAIIKTGSFNQDSKGRWFVNITFESKLIEQKHSNPTKSVGIDLGIKDLMTLSDGTSFPRANVTKKYEDQLARVKRAKKKKLVTSIHCKIKNCRNDYLHKLSTKIMKQYGNIAVGDVSSQDIIDKDLSSKMNSSIYDAGWYSLKLLFKYKAIKFGAKYEEISESFTTQECNACGNKTGPKGTEGLNIRNWNCISCGTEHQRDINAAKNIEKRLIRKQNTLLLV